MKWFTHKAIAVAGALALDAPGPGIIATLIGSILPDVTDTTLSMGNKQRWRKIHRQTSHWFGWYLLLMLIGALSIPSQIMKHSLPIQTAQLASECIVWVGFGGIMHVLLDALTPMGIPVWPLGGKQRMGFKLVTTGSIGEMIFLIFALGLIAYQFEQTEQIFYSALQKLSPTLFSY